MGSLGVEVCMGTPTPSEPIIKNDDGSVSMLVYLGRTFRLLATHEGLTDYAGYKARFGLTDKYGNAVLAEASTEDGSIVLSLAVAPVVGTVLSVTITDELMDIAAKGGKFDFVLEEPGGAEIPIMVGDWVAWKLVTP